MQGNGVLHLDKFAPYVLLLILYYFIIAISIIEALLYSHVAHDS
jgi:hypothetical protein